MLMPRSAVMDRFLKESELNDRLIKSPDDPIYESEIQLEEPDQVEHTGEVGDEEQEEEGQREEEWEDVNKTDSDFDSKDDSEDWENIKGEDANSAKDMGADGEE